MLMEEKKRCPYCGEEILAIARKCKHCGEWLDTPPTTNKTRSCPVCGEDIDASAKICPYCNEPTGFTVDNAKYDTTNQNNITDANAGEYLYCRNCNERISANADACPICGDKDPFFFHDIKKKKKIGWPITFLLAITLLKNINIINHTNKQKIFIFVGFLIICLVLLYLIHRLVTTLFANKHMKKMNKIFHAKGDYNATSTWKSKLEEFCDE